MQQKGSEELESVAPFEVVDHGSKLAVRAQWLSALKVRLNSHQTQTEAAADITGYQSSTHA